MVYLTHLECGRCGAREEAQVLQNLCRSCGGPLLARYDLEAVGRAVGPADLERRKGEGMWKYGELLPSGPHTRLFLGEGDTPILHLGKLGRAYGLPRLLMKEEGLNPTGSFKARGAAVGVARARELGASSVALPTAGNAGGAWAAYAALAGLSCHVFMPADAPAMFKSEAMILGAKTYIVEGLISDAGRIMEEEAEREGWFVASTLKEPYRIEGKKTMGFEIAEALGWRWPSVILYPTGGGVGLIAIWKAVQELRQLGWMKDQEVPRMVAVQASGCRPVVEAFRRGLRDTEPYRDASTVAAGIRVPGGLGHFLVLEAIYDSGGTAVEVGDEEILEEMGVVASTEGLWICPEGAAAMAAARRLREEGFIQPEETVMVLNTGSGIKYQELVSSSAPYWPGTKQEKNS